MEGPVPWTMVGRSAGPATAVGVDYLSVNQQLFFALERDSDGYPPWEEEELWGEPVGDSLFRLTVTPTFARGISDSDVVHAVPFEGRLYVDRLVRSGGHSTIRIVLFDDDAHDELLEICDDNQCRALHTEIPGLFSIDVPPESSVARLIGGLKRGVEAGLWDVDEGAIADDHVSN